MAESLAVHIRHLTTVAAALVLAVGIAACGASDEATSTTSTTTSTTAVEPTTLPSSPSTVPVPSSTEALVSTSPAPAVESAPAAADAPEVVVFTRTAGFRHTSIEPAAASLVAGLQAVGVEVAVDPDAARATDQGLSGVDAVVLLSTTGDWLDGDQQAAIERWAASGGGVAGIHAATDAEPDWPFLEALFGARFAGHPAIQPATVNIEDPAHPAMAGVPNPWMVTDEWYDFSRNPRDGVHVLATVDETTYSGGTMGSDHPIEWCRDPSAIAGRTWYTAMGHPDELWADPTFTAHVVAGVAWVAGAIDDPAAHALSISTGATVGVVAERLANSHSQSAPPAPPVLGRQRRAA